MTPEERAALFEEQAAEQTAKHSPPVPINQAISGSTRDVSIKFGRRVIARAKEASYSSEEIQHMRERMMKWLDIIQAFEVDRLEIREDEKMDDRQKAVLLASMRTELDRARVGIFGE